MGLSDGGIIIVALLDAAAIEGFAENANPNSAVNEIKVIHFVEILAVFVHFLSGLNQLLEVITEHS